MQYKKNILTGGHGVVYVTPKEGGREDGRDRARARVRATNHNV